MIYIGLIHINPPNTRNDNLHLQENKTYNKIQRLDQILKDKDVHYANAFELWKK